MYVQSIIHHNAVYVCVIECMLRYNSRIPQLISTNVGIQIPEVVEVVIWVLELKIVTSVSKWWPKLHNVCCFIVMLFLILCNMQHYEI